MKKQGANDRLDESLGMRDGAESTKSQSYKSRRDESRGDDDYSKGMKDMKGMKGMKGMKSSSSMPKDFGHATKTYSVNVPEGQGFSEVKPFRTGNLGYPKQAFEYKY